MRQKTNEPNGFAAYDRTYPVRSIFCNDLDAIVRLVISQKFQPGEVVDIGGCLKLLDLFAKGFQKYHVRNASYISVKTTFCENVHFFSALICAFNFFLNVLIGWLRFSFMPSVINSAKYMSSKFLPFRTTRASRIVPISCATNSASRLFLNSAINNSAMVFRFYKDKDNE